MWSCQMYDRLSVALRAKEGKSVTQPILLKNGTNWDVNNVSLSATLKESRNSSNHQESHQNKPKPLSKSHKSLLSSMMLSFLNEDITSITAQAVENELRTSRGQMEEQDISMKSHNNSESYRKDIIRNLKNIRRKYLEKPQEHGIKEKNSTFLVSEEMKPISGEKMFEHNKIIQQDEKAENCFAQNFVEVGSDHLADTGKTDSKSKLGYSFWEEIEISDALEVMEIDSKNQEIEQVEGFVQHLENNEIIFHPSLTEIKKYNHFAVTDKNQSEYSFQEEKEISDVSEVIEIDSENQENEQLVSVIHPKTNKIIFQKNLAVETKMYDREELQEINLVDSCLRNDIDRSNIKLLETVSIENKVSEMMEIGPKDQENKQLVSAIQPENNKIINPQNFTAETGVYDPKELQKLSPENLVECMPRDDIVNSNIKVLQTEPVDNEVLDVLNMVVGDVEKHVEKQKEFLKHLKIIERDLNQNSEVVERCDLTILETSNIKVYAEEQNAFIKQTEIIDEVTNSNFPSTIPKKDIYKRGHESEVCQVHLPVKRVKKVQGNVQEQAAKSVDDNRGKKRKISQNNAVGIKRMSIEEQENTVSRNNKTQQIIIDDECLPPLILAKMLKNSSRSENN